MTPDLLAASLPSPLKEHFLAGRYRDFEQLAQGSQDYHIELARDHIHQRLAGAFARDGVDCCANLHLRQLQQPLRSAPVRPDEESSRFYGLRHLYRGQPLTLPLEAEIPRSRAAYPGPYLAAHPTQIQAWERRLGRWPGQRIGLIWGPGLALQAFEPLAPGQFFGLQQGPHQIQAHWPPPTMDLIDLSEYLEDWGCVAGLLHHLDLLISVDHPTAHLAAAMGRPVWAIGQTMKDYGPGLRTFSTLKKLWTAWSSMTRRPARRIGKRRHEHAAPKPPTRDGTSPG